MSKEQAEELASIIRQQFPLRYVVTLQSNDMRNAPSNYFVAISRSYEEGRSLIIHSRYEWDKALLAWDILRDWERIHNNDTPPGATTRSPGMGVQLVIRKGVFEMPHNAERTSSIKPIIVPVDVILHTEQQPFCLDASCPCRDDRDNIKLLEDLLNQGILTEQEAKRILKGATI